MNKKYNLGTQWRVKDNDAQGILVGVATPRNPKSRSHGTRKVISLHMPDNSVQKFLKHEIEHIVNPDEVSKKNAEIVLLTNRLVNRLSDESLYAKEVEKQVQTLVNTCDGKNIVKVPRYQVDLKNAEWCANQVGEIAGNIFRLREDLVYGK